MPVTLSIKNVPDRIAQQLRKRAAANHRSLQGELMAILEDAVQPTITIEELAAHAKASGLRMPNESVAMIRADRDGRRR
jgi:plasmid stability protein